MTTRRTLCPLAIDLGIYALITLIMCRCRLEQTKDFYLFLHEEIVSVSERENSFQVSIQNFLMLQCLQANSRDVPEGTYVI